MIKNLSLNLLFAFFCSSVQACFGDKCPGSQDEYAPPRHSRYEIVTHEEHQRVVAAARALLYPPTLLAPKAYSAPLHVLQNFTGKEGCAEPLAPHRTSPDEPSFKLLSFLSYQSVDDAYWTMDSDSSSDSEGSWSSGSDSDDDPYTSSSGSDVEERSTSSSESDAESPPTPLRKPTMQDLRNKAVRQADIQAFKNQSTLLGSKISSMASVDKDMHIIGEPPPQTSMPATHKFISSSSGAASSVP
ncbi:MAG: hypothetical protein C0514_00760 [Candidatus Puniceispirillum sp.]|nr:hypothetical protein [Candidatus Puniceispirillum sp.]